MLRLTSSRKPLTALLLALAILCTAQTQLPASAQILRGLPADEIYDEYFFTSDGESVSIKANALVIGTKGTLIELKNNTDVNVIAGTATIATKGSSVVVMAGTSKVTVPASSTITIQNSGEQLSSFVAAQAPQLRPLFVVGSNTQIEAGEIADTILLNSGQTLICPNRNLKIKTPLGMVSAPAQSRFLISVMPGVVRVYNCQSKELKFAFENKHRRISIAEEFSVFDHRPTQEEVLPNDGIGRKEVTLHDLDGQQVTAATTTFSVLSLLTSPQFLKTWKRRSSYDKKLEHGFLKAAAAHSATSSNSESFYQSPIGGRPDQSAR